MTNAHLNNIVQVFYLDYFLILLHLLLKREAEYDWICIN
jgi:hypothetical protein